MLPVFLAVALADAGRLDQIWPRLAELREKARGFRKHRVELDESLALGEVSDTSRRLLMAVRSEAFQLTELLGFGYKLVAHVAGRIFRATPPQLPDDIATDAMPRIGRLWGLPPSHGERFSTRFEQLASLRIVA